MPVLNDSDRDSLGHVLVVNGPNPYSFGHLSLVNGASRDSIGHVLVVNGPSVASMADY